MAGVDIRNAPPVEDITCTLCNDVYTNAKNLACGHKFCQPCLESGCPSQCPVCKDDIPETMKVAELTSNKETNMLVGIEMAQRVKNSYQQLKANSAKEGGNEGECRRHKGIVCSMCEKKDFAGVRYICGVCSGYNLCEDCEEKLDDSKHDKTHIFVKLKRPAVNAEPEGPVLDEIAVKMGEAMVFDRRQHMVLEKVKESTFRKLGSVECDRCMSPKSEIQGIRYKCGDCKDYDLCGDCEKRSDIVHDPSHVFLKVGYPVNKIIDGQYTTTICPHKFY